MGKSARELQPIHRKRAEQLEQHDEFRMARTLLNRHITIATPRGVITVEILEVEPFSEMLKADHQRDFESK